ncbi:hypothetical protein ACQVDT_21440 [Streptomyces sp. RMIT01]
MSRYVLHLPANMPDWQVRAFLNRFNRTNEERNGMLRVTNETKAVLRTEGTGRVIGFVKSDEPGRISIAVPADRAVMTATQARQLAAWLNDEAAKAEKSSTESARTSAGWRAAEAQRQEEIRAALGGQFARRF